MPIHFGLCTPLFPYSCNSGLLPGQCCSLAFSHISASLIVTTPTIFSVLQMSNTHPSLTVCFSRIAFLLMYREWIWPLGTSPFSATNVPWCVLGQQHVKVNKIRLWWWCDKVSAPMAVPGLWQAPGQMFLATPGWWLTNSISHQNSRPKPGGNGKVSCKKGPQGVLPSWALGTLSEGKCS